MIHPSLQLCVSIFGYTMSICLQTIAQFNQSIEISPCKPQQEHVDSGTGFLDSSTRSFPSLPDDATERDASGSGSGSGRATMTTRYSSSTSSSSRGARDQRGGGEHMFHQQVRPLIDMCEWWSWMVKPLVWVVVLKSEFKCVMVTLMLTRCYLSIAFCRVGRPSCWGEDLRHLLNQSQEWLSWQHRTKQGW